MGEDEVMTGLDAAAMQIVNATGDTPELRRSALNVGAFIRAATGPSLRSFVSTVSAAPKPTDLFTQGYREAVTDIVWSCVEEIDAQLADAEARSLAVKHRPFLLEMASGPRRVSDFVPGVVASMPRATKVLAKLRGAGLAEIAPFRSDGRVRAHILTAKGSAVLDGLHPVGAAHSALDSEPAPAASEPEFVPPRVDETVHTLEEALDSCL